MWVYRQRASHNPPTVIWWEVGFYVGAEWEAPMRVNTEGEAKLWVHYLNGGDGPKGLEPS
jgi:hypothetical protein